MKILVADDEATNRLVLAVMLRRLGHEVRAVADGSEVLRELQHHDTDLVLIDVHMPVMDGIESAKIIGRTMGNLGRPILIAMTASDDRRIRQVCMAAGIDDLMLKPITMASLRKTLTRWPARSADPRRFLAATV